MKNAVSRMGRALIDKCSGFPHYFSNVQSGNCDGCPDCHCVEGPSVAEARQDYRAMVRVRNSAFMY